MTKNINTLRFIDIENRHLLNSCFTIKELGILRRTDQFFKAFTYYHFYEAYLIHCFRMSVMTTIGPHESTIMDMLTAAKAKKEKNIFILNVSSRYKVIVDPKNSKTFFTSNEAPLKYVTEGGNKEIRRCFSLPHNLEALAISSHGETEREMRMQNKLQACPYVNRHTAEVEICDKKKGLLTPWAIGGDLEDFLDEHTLSKGQKLALMRQLALAYQSIHSYGVVHLDIKLRNILYHNDGVKICDFGHSQEVKSLWHGKVTWAKAPPEALFESNLMTDSSFDVWGLGLAFYQIWTNDCVPWEDDMYNAMQNLAESNKCCVAEEDDMYGNLSESSIEKIKLLEDDKYRAHQLDLSPNDPVTQILEAMLRFDPRKRPSMTQIIRGLSLIRQKTSDYTHGTETGIIPLLQDDEEDI